MMVSSGCITQAVRGFSSLLTKSSRELAPAAPSAASAATDLGSLSYTTAVCPFFISRRTMLPPIRPRPIMPSCILASLVQCFRYGGIKCCQRRGEVALEMNPQRPSSAFGEHVEIAACRRCLDDTKTRLLARHRQIPGVIGGDLQEHAAVRTALVGLAGRMQETRAEFGAGGDVALVAHRRTHFVQDADRAAVAGDIGQQRHIVAAARTREVRLD